jgi:hypothetical protein
MTLDPRDVDRIRQSMARLQGAAAPSPGGQGERSPQFPDLESWVNGFFVLTFGRPSEQASWCAHWWDHPEAVLRLSALWRTWEAAALDPVGGMAAWIRDHLDPGLAVLLSPTGPFAGCRDEHVKPQVLPVAPTPPGWWSSEHWWDVLAEDDG